MGYMVEILYICVGWRCGWDQWASDRVGVTKLGVVVFMVYGESTSTRCILHEVDMVVWVTRWESMGCEYRRQV